MHCYYKVSGGVKGVVLWDKYKRKCIIMGNVQRDKDMQGCMLIRVLFLPSIYTEKLRTSTLQKLLLILLSNRDWSIFQRMEGVEY